jgi:hypothetical protein
VDLLPGKPSLRGLRTQEYNVDDRIAQKESMDGNVCHVRVNVCPTSGHFPHQHLSRRHLPPFSYGRKISRTIPARIFAMKFMTELDGGRKACNFIVRTRVSETLWSNCKEGRRERDWVKYEQERFECGFWAHSRDGIASLWLGRRRLGSWITANMGVAFSHNVAGFVPGTMEISQLTGLAKVLGTN